MAQRDLIRTAKRVEGTIARMYDMKPAEANKLADMAADDPFTAVRMAFQYGYAMGGRAAQTGHYTELQIIQ